MQYNDNLAKMTGTVRQVKPMAPSSLIQDMLNARMRTLLNKRPFWAGLMITKPIGIPAGYSTGSIDVFRGSKVVIGTGTNWPVNDVVNTTIPIGNLRIGPQWFTPGSITNIDDDSVLYIDAGGTPEVVPITKVDSQRCYGYLRFPHDPNCTVWMSSLVHRQLRMPERNPYYDIVAVPADNELILAQTWQGQDLTAGAYSIVKAWLTIDSKLKQIEAASESVQRIPMKVHVSQKKIMEIDPYRLASNSPFWIVDNAKNVNNNMTFEVYPPSTSERQITVVYFQEWPPMTEPTDCAPPFIDPSVLVYGALADLLPLKLGTLDEVNFGAAQKYQKMFDDGVDDCVIADESKMMQGFQSDRSLYGMGPGSDFWVNRDPLTFWGEI